MKTAFDITEDTVQPLHAFVVAIGQEYGLDTERLARTLLDRMYAAPDGRAMMTPDDLVDALGWGSSGEDREELRRRALAMVDILLTLRMNESLPPVFESVET